MTPDKTAELTEAEKQDIIFNLARDMHNSYEDFSRKQGWETNKKCRVPFEDLPLDNRKVMYRMAEWLLGKHEFIVKQLKQELAIKEVAKNEQEIEITRLRRELTKEKIQPEWEHTALAYKAELAEANEKLKEKDKELKDWKYVHYRDIKDVIPKSKVQELIKWAESMNSKLIHISSLKELLFDEGKEEK